MMTVAIPAASTVSRNLSRVSAMLDRSSGLMCAQQIVLARNLPKTSLIKEVTHH